MKKKTAGHLALFWLLSLFVKTDKIDKGDYIRP